MNCRTSSILILALASASGVSRGADSGSFDLETRIYVYKNSDFQTITVPGRAAGQELRGAVFTAPATAQFGQETLSLDGSSFAWSGGRNPPAHFSLVATPKVPLVAGTPVTLSSSVPVQYLEKQPDGALKVREIPVDSPDAPHCSLTFSVAPPAEPGGEPAFTCALDIVTVTAREGVTGVALEVGKPVLARLQETLHPIVRPGAWSALVCQAPNGSDYSMLVLLKITPGPGAAATAAPAENAQIATPAQLEAFAAHYYQHPAPALISAAIEAFGAGRFAPDHAQMFVGFFAEVFAANPDRVAAWRAVVERQTAPAKDYLHTALELGHPGAVLSPRGRQTGFGDKGGWGLLRDFIREFRRDPGNSVLRPVLLNVRYWGGYFASGDPAYLRALVNELRLIDELNSYDSFMAGATAMLSLARTAPEHPAVRSTLEAMRSQVEPRTREILDEILTEKPELIREKLASLGNEVQAPPLPPDRTNQIDGEAENRSAESPVGPANPSDRAYIDSMRRP